MAHASRVRVMVCILVAVTLVITPFGAAPAASEADGKYIVMYVEGTCLTCEASLLTALRLRLLGIDVRIEVTHVLTLINALAIKIPPGFVDYVLGLLDPLNPNPLNVINNKVAEVVDDLLTFVDPICPTTTLPSISESYPWGQLQIEVPAVHPEWQGSGVKVAILDTGLATHCEFSFPDDPLCLSSRVATGYNALPGGGSYFDDHGHGTHMAGIIGANLNSQSAGIAGIVGVAPQATFAAVKVLDEDGHGYVSDVVDGLQWVHDQNMGKVVTEQIRLVNMSFGFSFSNPSDGTPLKKAIQKLSNEGIIMVASAGNLCQADGGADDGGGADCRGGGPAADCDEANAPITAPAAYSGVLAVGATRFDGQIATYSRSGEELAVVAPGGEPDSTKEDNGQILSTNKDGLYGRGHGTSQAAAHVTGAVALALALEAGLTPECVRDLLKLTPAGQPIDVPTLNVPTLIGGIGALCPPTDE